MAALRIKLMDENGNILNFANDPVNVSISGAGELIGPKSFALNGGMGGTYVRTIGEKGRIELSFKCPVCEEVSLTLEVI